MSVSEPSQAREAQKIAPGPLVPGVLAGRRSLHTSAFRAVFGMSKMQRPSPNLRQLSVAAARSRQSTSILCDLFCGPPCATQLMQPQCDQGPVSRSNLRALDVVERRGLALTELLSCRAKPRPSFPLDVSSLSAELCPVPCVSILVKVRLCWKEDRCIAITHLLTPLGACSVLDTVLHICGVNNNAVEHAAAFQHTSTCLVFPGALRFALEKAVGSWMKNSLIRRRIQRRLRSPLIRGNCS